MKSYTDIEQSKKLAEILPLESADMLYIMFNNGEKPKNGDDKLSTVYEDNEHKWYWIDIRDESWNMRVEKDIPCWSLAALLNYLKSKNKFPDIKELGDGRFKLTTFIWDGKKSFQVFIADNLVDACYKLVLKLHECEML